MKRYLLSIVVTALSSIPFLLQYPSSQSTSTMHQGSRYVSLHQSSAVTEISITTVDVSMPTKLESTPSHGSYDHLPLLPENEISSSATRTSIAYSAYSHTDIMSRAGIHPSDYSAVEYIISKESSWSYGSRNESSGAYGLCQALPASKMLSFGDDYLSNPITQLKWCNDYAQSRYGGWTMAKAFWEDNHWW